MGYPVEFQLLGPVQIQLGAEAVILPGARRNRLLAALVLDANRVVTIDRLVDVIWPVEAPATARRQVQDLVGIVRRELSSAGCPESVLTARGSGYQLSAPPEAIDLARFRQRVSASRSLHRDDPLTAVATLRSALGLWRGDALAGLNCPALDAARVGLDESRLTAWEECLSIELGLEGHDDLISELAMLVELHPWRERLMQLYLHALHRAGRTSDAVAAYHNLRRVLADELGTQPGQGLQRMFEAIVRDDPDLAPRLPRGQPLIVTIPEADKPHELPPDIADFTGRADYLLQLHAIVSGAVDPARHGPGVPVAVVSGPGGVGKSALAVRAAHLLAPLFPDGQVFAHLRGTGPHPLDRGGLLARLLHALGTRGEDIPPDSEWRAAMFRSRVFGRRLLFLLDDVEHASQVQDALPASAGCAVLVTSRNQLRSLPGATHVHLEPLPTEEAMVLFRRVAGADRSAGEPAAIEAMVRLSAGLPLALRIVAAQLAGQPDTTATALAMRLDDERRRLDEFEIEDISVRSSFQVGYDSLAARGGADLVRALRWLSLSDGPQLDIMAAAVLLDSDVDVCRSILTRLVDASLLMRNAGGRYELHDLLRLFARERSEAEDTTDDRTSALRRLHAWLLCAASYASRVLTPERRHADVSEFEPTEKPQTFDRYDDALGWFDLEIPNLVSAVHQSAAVGDHDIAWKLATTLWDTLTLRGNFADWISTHEVALRSAVALDDRYAQAWIATNLSTAYTRVGRTADAIEVLSGALAAVRAMGNRVSEASVLANLGNAHQEQAEFEEALDLYDEALSIHRSEGQRYGECLALLNVADVCRQLTRYDRARQSYHAALDLDLGDDHLAGVALTGLGDVSVGQGRTDAAIEYYLRAVEIHRRAGNRPDEAGTLDSLAAALQSADRAVDARRYQFEAELIRRDLESGRHPRR